MPQEHESVFRNKFSSDIWQFKYNQGRFESWWHLANRLCHDVCGGLMPESDILDLVEYMARMKWLPGGRYIYYAGRNKRFWNNCFLYRSLEDTREDWANTFRKIGAALMTGGGIGNDYSVYRAAKSPISGTGGEASGPIPAMQVVNDLGRQVMQGGSRRSAMYASLNWRHGDIKSFLKVKDWHKMPIPGTSKTLWDAKVADFNFPAPMDMTNISVNYDTKWVEGYGKTGEVGEVFLENAEQALRTGEPGFSFNFWDKENETLRNACCELTSEDDSDVCNLASLNMVRIESLEEFVAVSELVTKFQICATMRAELPHPEVYRTREKNRRLGQGLMGMHEWLLKKGLRYEMNPELAMWLGSWRYTTDKVAAEFADSLGISRPVGRRAIAPTGSIAILAGTTGGIEPLFAVAYKRRYLKEGTKWHYQYVVDSVAEELVHQGVDPDKIETALDLARDPERRIRFQADVQDYVDHAISSTINLPAWGSAHNNEDKVRGFAQTLAKYAHRLRGFTCYPDGSRGGQPLSVVSYSEAKNLLGNEFEEHVQTNDVCEIGGKGGSCGA